MLQTDMSAAIEITPATITLHYPSDKKHPLVQQPDEGISLLYYRLKFIFQML